MAAALGEARAAAARGEVPIGAVVVGTGGAVLAAAGNRTRELKDPTAHAEVLAIRAACAAVGAERLVDCDLYVTLEPCPMCAGAFINARIERVVYGCDDPRAGAVRSLWALANDPRLNHRCAVTAGVRAAECAEVLRAFFRARRKLKGAAG